MTTPKNVVLLFDEQGTPTFRADRETDSFLGVGVAYIELDEKNVFEKCEPSFGLANSKPLKNKNISSSRAIKISELAATLPVQIVVRSLNLSNSDFKEVTELYAEIGNFIRQKHRKVRRRPISQILHSRLLDYTLFDSITRFVEFSRTDSAFHILIDDWAIPKSDREIVIELTSESLQAKINSLFDEFSFEANISVSPINLLSRDSQRKRFVDVIASVTSRAFLDRSNLHFSETPLTNILNASRNIYQDVTKEVINFMRDLMDELLRE